MVALTNSISELEAERAAWWAQLDVDTRSRAGCPGLDLDEYRELRQRANKRITEIDLVLAEHDSVTRTTPVGQRPKGFLSRVLAVVL